MALLFKAHNDFYEILEDGSPGTRVHFSPGDEVPQWVIDTEQDISHLTYDPDEVDEDFVPEGSGGDYEGISKEGLIQLLAERELPVSGNKADLIARLEADDAAK